MGFQYYGEAKRFLKELQVRIGTFGLALHPDKTRLIQFGRFAAENRQKRGESKPETFDFLGFTHICGTKRSNGGFTVKRRTMAKRMRAKLKAVKVELMQHRHEHIATIGAWLGRVVKGYLNYHAVPGNAIPLNSFRREIQRLWYRSLRRRSQRNRMTWKRFGPIVNAWIPPVRILHPYPNERFYAKYPKQEPYAARTDLCEGRWVTSVPTATKGVVEDIGNISEC